MPSSSHAQTAGLVTFVPLDDDVTAAEASAIEKAGEITNAVKNSDCFRDFMTTRKLLQTNGRAPHEVAAHLRGISGTVRVGFYFRCLEGRPGCTSPTSAVAYRLPPDTTVYINKAYYEVESENFDLYELAGSLAHEAVGHALGGYQHAFDWTPARDFSVPYSISGASSGNDDAFRHCRAPLGFGHPARNP